MHQHTVDATAGSRVDAQDGASDGKTYHITYQTFVASSSFLSAFLTCLLQEVTEGEWQKAGIGRLATREQLAALRRDVEPVRAAIQALADRSAELQAAVHAEGIQRNMGRAKQGIRRLGLLGQAGLLVGDEETTKKYR
eukprot:COSAG02_NODE_209_length_28965_cov_18.680143_7_plen_138_part_00